MSVIVSSFMPFPNIAWWIKAIQADAVIFDKAEHFEKMSYRNKYYITGANGMITLSIPLVNGRQQRNTMGKIEISNTEAWQVQHWRTLVSVYKRSPYFEHYELSLQKLFETQYQHLVDFDIASVQWLAAQLKMPMNVQFAETYQKEMENTTDLRNLKRSKELHTDSLKYYQLFEERNGFLPNLSLLDLLFSEGPATAGILKKGG